MDELQLTELVGLVDDGRDGRADPGGGWGQGNDLREVRAVTSTAVYINRS
jgi:hypothetical protein